MILIFIYVKLRTSLNQQLVFLLFTPFIISCVGPVTPFGALNLIKKDKIIKTNKDLTIANIEIALTPKKQNLHSLDKLKISVYDPEGISKDAKIKVFYNDLNVTESFFRGAVSNKKKHIWDIEFKNIKLLNSKDHDVYFEYQKRSDDNVYSFEWEKPDCFTYNKTAKLLNTKNFSPSKKILKSIKKLSSLYSVNPALMAGLIAQESAFNSKAISWAKAIGLTQVTPIADLELRKYHKTWPRSEDIANLPVPVLKSLISYDKITPKDDWRLNPELSIEGGLTYLRYITKYWYKPKNKKLLMKYGLTSKDDLNGVFLASYNSGSSRVGYAIRKKGKKFLNYKTLGEAKKYVNKIKSYCYHFSEEERL